MCAPAPALASQIFLTSHIFLTCVHPRLRPLAPAPALTSQIFLTGQIFLTSAPAPAPACASASARSQAQGACGWRRGRGGRGKALFAFRRGGGEGLIKDLNGKAAGRLQKGDGGTRGYSRLEMGEIVLLLVLWVVRRIQFIGNPG